MIKTILKTCGVAQQSVFYPSGFIVPKNSLGILNTVNIYIDITFEQNIWFKNYKCCVILVKVFSIYLALSVSQNFSETQS